MKTEEARSVLRSLPFWIGTACGFLAGFLVFWFAQTYRKVDQPTLTPVSVQTASPASTVSGGAVINLYAHNLRLHQGPDFRVYIEWLRGQLTPVRPGIVPSFDKSESFYLNVTNGVIKANVGDINNYLNAMSAQAPFREIRISGNRDQVRITGKLHKLIALPVELLGILQPAPDNRFRIHVTKINLLKIPFKALLGGFHITLADFMQSGKIQGVDVTGNDITFDPQTLLPPPHIRGQLTKVSMGDPDVEATYGDASKDVELVEGWRNFLRLKNGSLSFGKLTMHDVDLMMVDISQDPWFDLDLANYQAQLESGYTRITPQSGVQIFMPDVSELKKRPPIDTSIQWYKNRNVAPPSEVVPKK